MCMGGGKQSGQMAAQQAQQAADLRAQTEQMRADAEAARVRAPAAASQLAPTRFVDAATQNAKDQAKARARQAFAAGQTVLTDGSLGGTVSGEKKVLLGD